MTLTQLEYLLALNQFRHFQQAAKHCNVAQPSLSAQIQKLEEELGFKIFDRGSQPIIPTLLGEKVIQQARIILKEAAKVTQISNLKEAPKVIRLGIVESLSSYLFSYFLNDFLSANPNIKLEIVEQNEAELVTSLASDKIDAAILTNSQKLPNCSERFLIKILVCAYLSEKHPLLKENKILLSQLNLQEILLLADYGSWRMKVSDQIEKIESNTEGRFAINSESFNSLIKIIDLQGGLTLIPSFVANELRENQQSRIRHFENPIPEMNLYLIFRTQFLNRDLLDNLAENLTFNLSKIKLV